MHDLSTNEKPSRWCTPVEQIRGEDRRLALPQPAGAWTPASRFRGQRGPDGDCSGEESLLCTGGTWGRLEPLVSHYAREPATPHEVVSYDRALDVLRVLGGALELARGRLALGRRVGRRRVVEAAHRAAEARAEDRRPQHGHRRQPDVQDAGVAGRAAGLRAPLLGRRHLQPDRAVQRDLYRVVVGRVRQRAQTNVLQAALAPRRYAQALSAMRGKLAALGVELTSRLAARRVLKLPRFYYFA